MNTRKIHGLVIIQKEQKNHGKCIDFNKLILQVIEARKALITTIACPHIGLSDSINFINWYKKKNTRINTHYYCHYSIYNGHINGRG